MPAGDWSDKPPEKYNLFSATDPEFHRSEKRKIGNAYSLPRLLESEEAVDSCTQLFVTRLRELTKNDRPIDLGVWLQYYAFDVVGDSITHVAKYES